MRIGIDILELDGLLFSNFEGVLRWLALNTNVPLPKGPEEIMGAVETLEWMANIPRVFRRHLPGWIILPINFTQ